MKLQNLLFCWSQSSVWTFRRRLHLNLSEEGTLPSSAAPATSTASDRCPRLVRCRTARATSPAAMQYGKASSLSASVRHSACLHNILLNSDSSPLINIITVFCTAHSRVQHTDIQRETDRHTNHNTCDICSSRPHLHTACRRRGLKIRVIVGNRAFGVSAAHI